MLAKLVNAVGSSVGDGMAVDERALEVDAAPKPDDEEEAVADDEDDMMGDFFFFANAASNPALENAQLALSTARAVGALVPASVTAKQISLGSPGAVLDMVWALWKRSLTDTVSVRAKPEAVCLLDASSGEELGDLMRLRPEEMLVRWVNHQLDLADAWASDTRCTGFGSELADGRMLAAIVRQLASDEEHKSYLPGDDAARDSMSVEDLAGNTIWVASQLGVPEWFSVGAITSGNVRLQIAFVAMLWQKVEGSMGVTHSAQLEKRRRSSVVVRRRTLGARDMAAVRRELATMIKEEEEDADAETISRETRVQRQWVNSLGLPGVAVHDLPADVRDGVVLLRVIDKIEPGLISWKKVHRNPKNRYQKVENCNAALRVCKALDMRIVNLSGPDIAAGNPKLVAAVAWQLMRHHTLRILSSVAFKGFDVTEKQVLEWANERLAASERLTGFSDPSLSTSVPLLRVMHSVRPVVDWTLVTVGSSEEDRKQNAQYLLSVARKMGAAAFCTWEDVVQVKPKMIMTLLASAIVVDQRTHGGAEAEAAARAAAVRHDLDDDDFGAKVSRVADFHDSDDEDDEDDDEAGAAAAAAAAAGASA
jgi:plastin-1